MNDFVGISLHCSFLLNVFVYAEQRYLRLLFDSTVIDYFTWTAHIFLGFIALRRYGSVNRWTYKQASTELQIDYQALRYEQKWAVEVMLLNLMWLVVVA